MQIIDNRQKVFHFPDEAAKSLELFAQKQHSFFKNYPTVSMTERLLIKYDEWYWEHFARQVRQHIVQAEAAPVDLKIGPCLYTMDQLIEAYKYAQANPGVSWSQWFEENYAM